MGGEFTSKQFTWLSNELGFIKVYTSPYINIDWCDTTHLAMFGCDTFMSPLFKLLLPKLRYMGDEK